MRAILNIIELSEMAWRRSSLPTISIVIGLAVRHIERVDAALKQRERDDFPDADSPGESSSTASAADPIIASAWVTNAAPGGDRNGRRSCRQGLKRKIPAPGRQKK